jgi:ATP-binding cassette subfamily C protein CydD
VLRISARGLCEPNPALAMTQPTANPCRIGSWLRAHKGRAGRYLSYSVALGTLGGLLIVGQAWLLARIIDGAIFQHGELARLMPAFWALLGLFTLRALISRWSEQLGFRGAAQVKVALREQLFGHLQALGPVRLAAEGPGELANTLVDGVEALEAYYARYLPAMSLMALVPLILLAFIFPADWVSGLVMLLTAPLIPLFMVLIGAGAERLNQRQWRQLARMSAHFLDVIQGLTTLKLFNASRREVQTIARISQDYRRSTMSVLRVAFLSSAVLEFFSTVSIAVVAVLIGFRLLDGEMAFFQGFFVLLLAPELYLPLRNMGTHYHARMEAIGAAERMVELIETPVGERALGTRPPPDSRSLDIAFEQVSFAFEPRRPALDDLSLELPAGQRIALVGPSGAGKSTLIDLLLGFVQPDQGRITVNGLDLAEMALRTWREHLAWVPQSPRLFHGTLLDNVRLGRPDADMSAVEAAARRAHADEFIQKLPEGWETRIGELGQGLSGGQIQLLALARALLRDTPLVLLDEPTASLDPHSERMITDALKRLAEGRTLLTIAHRLHTVRQADLILVLDRGRLVQQGTHEALTKVEGVYRDMLLAHAGMEGTG